MNLPSRISFLAFAVSVPASAAAHIGSHEEPSFRLGLLHPLTGADHIALLVASGAIMALSARRGWRPTRCETVALAGLFGGGFAIMLGDIAIGLAALCAAIGGLAEETRTHGAASTFTARAGIAAALGLQAASHWLASGDLVSNAPFAAGFAATSLAIFFASERLFRPVSAWLQHRLRLTQRPN